MPTTGITGNILSFENRLVKLSSGPQTTLGLIITVFLKFSNAFCSPRNFDFWYRDFDLSLAPIALTWINFLTSDSEQILAIASGIFEWIL